MPGNRVFPRPFGHWVGGICSLIWGGGAHAENKALMGGLMREDRPYEET